MATRETPVYMRPINFALDVANGRSRYSRIIPPVLLALDAVLCGLVIWKIPYTEIDWKAYMEQVSQFVSGEYDYTKIKGGTGPLVYPAAHVYTYTVLYYLTDKGKDIFLAQQLFAVLYIVTLAVVMACYWKAKVPPYVLPLLILSKRLHSIFVLRCFNDCFAVLFLWLAIYFFQRKLWTFGALAYSWGLGIKMSLLLELPAVGLILFLARGFAAAMRVNRVMVHLQILTAAPFLLKNWRGYLGRAFELSRQFFYKWTVNWRMVDEEVFLSREFAIGLLVLHVSLLATFIVTRWLKPANKSIPELVKPLLTARAILRPEAQPIVGQGLSPRYVMTTMLTANVIGLLCARSLHYQFYAYLAWATPYLLWRSGVHPVLQYALWAVQEYAWNVFPSTKVSSMLVVDVMFVTVGLVWLGAKEEFQPQSERRAAKEEAASE